MCDSLEIRIEETQTTIPTPPSSPRTNVSLDKKIDQELTKDVSILTTTTSTHSHSKRQISSKYSHLPGVLHRMCKRQGYMIQDMERKKPQEFKAHAPSIIEDLFKNYVHSKVIHVHLPITTSIEPNSSADLQHQLYLKMKSSLQDRANDIELWEALKSKFEKTSTSNTSCRVDDFHSYHDEHQDDDAPPKGEKIVKRSKGLEVGSIRRIQGIGYGILEFLGVGTMLDIFQNIIFIPYFQYGVLLFSGYGVLGFFPLWSFVSAGTDTSYLP
ncbi:hypothetical protein Tco_1107810 [Tanacetum coccineum]